MKVYCENRYKSFKDLMKETYDLIYSDEKSGFTAADALALVLFSMALDLLCLEFKKTVDEIKEIEE